MRSKMYLVLLAFVFMPFLVFAADETLTITTYYPSPYGSYNEFKVASNTWLAYSSGNVGIGTTGPEAKLDVSGGGIAISTNDVAVSPSGYDLKIRSNTAKLGIHVDSGTASPILEFGIGGGLPGIIRTNTDSTTAVQVTTANGSTAILNVDSTNQRVGIGTTNPDNLLTLYKSTDASSARDFLYFRNGTYSTASMGFQGYTFYMGSPTANSAGGVVVRVDTGNVGIGTTSPGIIFEAMNNGASDPIGRFRRNATEYIDIGVDAQATNWKGAIWYNGTKQIEFYNRGIALGTYSDLTGANQIPAGGAIIPGNVSIGTPTPSGKLHVNYTGTSIAGLYVNNTDANDGAAAVSWRHNGTQVGSVTTASASTTYNTTSDARLKENIKGTAMGLDVLSKIQVRDFNFISEPGKRVQGLIAQELNEVYPFAVSVGGSDPKEHPWSLDYGRLTPLIIKSVQEQQKEIEALKSEIQQLKAKIK